MTANNKIMKRSVHFVKDQTGFGPNLPDVKINTTHFTQVNLASRLSSIFGLQLKGCYLRVNTIMNVFFLFVLSIIY